MNSAAESSLTDVIGAIPYRMAFAGGWIDQPFVSQRNPTPPGSMVVVGLEPTCWFMERSGMATGTRKVARRLWNGRLPDGDRMQLVKQLYDEENRGQADPSGSQDMIGLIYPGVNRLDFDFDHEGGYFPCHIESNNDPAVARWLEEVIYMLPVASRPAGYSPLGEKNLDAEWIPPAGAKRQRLFTMRSWAKDAATLGASMKRVHGSAGRRSSPHVVRHETIGVDLLGILHYYQSHYRGAMYSGCGGGYLYVVSRRAGAGGRTRLCFVLPRGNQLCRVAC